MENFIDIIGYEDLYQISEKGTIKALEKLIKGRQGCLRKIPEKIIKWRTDTKGYYQACLSKEGVKKYFSLHRLIAFYFVPNPENKPFINHKDGSKKNNSIENLEWCTAKENVSHSYHVLGNNAIDKGPKKLKKKVIQLDFNNNQIAVYNGVREAGRQTGVDQGQIGKCAQGIRKTAGGYIWRYE